MLNNFKIAIDLINKKEYFIKYRKKLFLDKKQKFYIFERDNISAKPLGNLFISFLNLDVKNEIEFKNYVFEYLFIPLLLNINPNIKYECEISKIMNIDDYFQNIILSEKEINFYYEIIKEKYLESILLQQKDFRAIAELKYYKMMLDNFNVDKSDPNYQNTLNTYNKRIKGETYVSSLDNYGFVTVNLRINYDTKMIFNNKIANNVPYYFSSLHFNEIIFISIKELVTYRRGLKISICKNCGKYFIPQTAHKTIYCDSIYRNNKTCC